METNKLIRGYSLFHTNSRIPKYCLTFFTLFLNFCRCFELSGTFPHDHTLKISVWDYDVTTSDDLIGETEIDLEERFFTKHRASCGIPECYEE